MAGLALVLIFLFAAFMRPLAGRRLGVAILSVLLIVSVSVSHHFDAWGVLFDKGLVRNMVETDVREVRELLSWSAFVDVLWRGLLPTALLCLVGLRRSRVARAVGQTFGSPSPRCSLQVQCF